MRIVALPSILLLSASLLGQASSKSDPATSQTMVNGTTKNVVHVLGLEGVTRNVKGELSVDGDVLEFKSATGQGQIKIAAIQDVFTGQDSKQVGGTPLSVVKLAAPFGSGRALSLFAHQKVDNLTIEYRDKNNGLHGAIFVLAKGQATLLKKALVAQGAHASSPVSEEAAQPPAAKDKK